MSKVRLPRLLGSDLTEKARLHPSRASATINLAPLSRASLTLPEGEPTVGVRDFVEVYGPEGSLGIFRTSSVQTTYGNQQQVSLEHGLVTLEDDLITTETVLSGAIRAALTKLLAMQTTARWKLGDVEVSGNIPETDVTTSNLLQAVLAVVESDETAMLAFDQSAVPWTLHVRKKPSVYACECRLNRNLNSVNIRLDDSSLCTLVTAEDIDGAMHTYTADTVGTWGIVHKYIMLDDGDDPVTVAKKYLDDHKEPTISIELDAMEMAKQTGEALDRFIIGTICRTALPEWGVSVDERVISISYSDLFGRPEYAKLTLSNGRRDASTQLSDLRSSALNNTLTIVKNARGIAQNLKYYHELEDKAVIMAKEIELRATKDELGKYLNEVYIKLDAHDASITLHAQNIDKVTHDISQAGIRLDGLNADLQIWATRTEENGRLISDARIDIDAAKAALTLQAAQLNKQGEQLSAAQIKLDGLEATIDLKVSKDGLISAINMSPEKITIQASKINLQGYVTASELSATKATIDNLMSGVASATKLVSSSASLGAVTCTSVTISGHQMVSRYRGYLNAQGEVEYAYFLSTGG